MSSAPRAPFRLRHVVIAGALALLTGCASGTAQAPYDPFEPVNRAVHGFNKGVDRVILRPLAKYAYGELVPDLAKMLVSNALDYIGTPVDFANAALQGDLDRTVHIGKRFVVNTTVGGLGLLDPATEAGLPALDEDFGQTLGVWGSGSGPYLELPFFGPSSGRDFVGRVVDRAFQPTSYFALNDEIPTVLSPGVTAAGILDTRSANDSAIDSVLYDSGDSYALVRSIFLQRREAAIRNGIVDASSGPDIFDDAY